MRDPIDERRERDLLELLSASEDPRAAFTASPLSADPGCVERFEELMDTKDLLDAAGRDARAEMDEAAALARAPGQARVSRVLGELIEGEDAPAPARRPLRRLLPWVAAAALAVSAGVWMRAGLAPPDGDGGDRRFLGAADEELRHPRGAVDTFHTEFDWSGVRGAWYVLRLRRAGGELFYTSPELEEPRWNPAEHGDPIPEDVRHVVWEVDVYDGSSAAPARTFFQECWLR